jgi:acyl-CoA synthetase (NDP forming)/GNAT superfamily N-acetyltransferase
VRNRSELDWADGTGRGVDAIRADGGLVHIRPITAEDRASLGELHARVSDRSIYLRFFSMDRRAADKYLDQLVQATTYEHRALVAIVDGELVGVAGYERLDATTAEIALLVADNLHGEGIGTLLIEHLASVARHEGITHCVADVLAENTSMITVFRDMGYAPKMSYEYGTMRVEFDLLTTDALVAAVDRRDRAAEVASLRPVLTPRSIAVIGASPRPDTIGHQLLRNIVDSGYSGSVYVVNPNHSEVLGIPSVPSPRSLPVAPDLAIIAVPAKQVPDAVRACGERGVAGVVLISSGFSEAGAEGSERQREVLRIARRHGMRLVGPNCLGLVNTDPLVRLNATFAPMPMLPGPLALASQSGAFGIALLSAAGRMGQGVSQFVSMGNKADVSSNDLMLAWEQDPQTKVIALYLESVGNPRKFARIARRISATKPIIAVKAGRSSSGVQDGQSHMAIAAVPDVVADALFEQAGIIRLAGMAELLDTARVLCDQPLPAGPRVAIVGNSSGPGILAADAAELGGLVVAELCPATREALEEVVPEAASLHNPIDLGAGATASTIEHAVRTLLAADEVDMVIAVFTETAVSDPDAVVRGVASTLSGTDKPVVIARVGGVSCSVAALDDGSETARVLPVYSFPEAAAGSLANAYRYTVLRDREQIPLGRPADIDVDAARAVVAEALAAGQDWLDADACARLLIHYGVPFTPERVVGDVEAAVEAARELGYPVAAKLAGRGLHKSDVGGVRLGLADESELRSAVAALQAIDPDSPAVLLQPMAQAAAEIIVGGMQEPLCGPIVLVGAGGVLADLVHDRAVHTAPLSMQTADDLLASLRADQLLRGYRGAAPTDREALCDLVARISWLVEDIPEVAELDLNPVMCGPTGVLAVDARIRVGQPAAAPDPLLRQLRPST